MLWYGLEISDEKLSRIRFLIKSSYHKNHVGRLKKTKDFDKNSNELNLLLSELYSSFGIKALVKMIGDPCSYTIIRRIFFDLQIKIKQRSKTEDLCRIRSIRAKTESPFRSWPQNPKFKNIGRGISGYFLNKEGKYCWLRSSYEFAYAKHLDDNDIKWTFEERYYKLSNKEKYLPDFFIYENGSLKEIVEIKSRYYNSSLARIKKAKRAAKEYGFKLKIVTQKELSYICNLRQVLKTWKKVRLLEKV